MQEHISGDVNRSITLLKCDCSPGEKKTRSMTPPTFVSYVGMCSLFFFISGEGPDLTQLTRGRSRIFSHSCHGPIILIYHLAKSPPLPLCCCRSPSSTGWRHRRQQTSRRQRRKHRDKLQHAQLLDSPVCAPATGTIGNKR